ncbi:hypothetical protein GQR58_022467 [Nymphon striatum]|nr:hypothetical protein GQR58_022467 [Nymphon striatum]
MCYSSNLPNFRISKLIPFIFLNNLYCTKLTQKQTNTMLNPRNPTKIKICEALSILFASILVVCAFVFDECPKELLRLVKIDCMIIIVKTVKKQATDHTSIPRTDDIGGRVDLEKENACTQL